jgi:uncharacterized oligopeptide transporter (OPT) family protein
MRIALVFAGCIPLALIAVALMKYVWGAEILGYPIVAVAVFVPYVVGAIPWSLRAKPRMRRPKA